MSFIWIPRKKQNKVFYIHADGQTNRQQDGEMEINENFKIERKHNDDISTAPGVKTHGDL